MELIETPVFTRQITEQLSDDDYRALQLYLILRPGPDPSFHVPEDCASCAGGYRAGGNVAAAG
jgi:hypothetical protein